MTPGQVISIISQIEEQNRTQRESFSPTRYPYTYAYDYMRSHSQFNCHNYSRSDCARVLKDNAWKENIVVLLAEAYLREHNVEKPFDFVWDIPSN